MTWTRELDRGRVGWLAALALGVLAASIASLVFAPAAAGIAIERSPAPSPKNVLLLGDSLMFDAAPALMSVFEEGGAAVVDQSVLGLGLTRPEYADWRTLWPDAIARHTPDTIVVFVAPFDLADLGLTTKSHEQWKAEYRDSVVEAVRLFGNEVRIVWILSPDYGDATLAGGVEVLNEAIRAAQADTPFDVLDPGPIDPTTDGKRKNDGIHFCPDGAADIATRLSSLLDLSVPGPSPAGPWRHDARYDASILGSNCTDIV